MRFNTFSVFFLVALALAKAVPTPKNTEDKPVAVETPIEKTAELSVDSVGEEKDRPKKSTTTFCVEIRPGAKEATPCECKDKAERIVVEPQTYQHTVVVPKPKPVIPSPPPPPPPTVKPKPIAPRPKPMQLPVPEEIIRPVVSPCSEPQVIVVPSNPLVFVPEQEHPKPAQIVQPHHHHCHKCGQPQAPVPDCQCSSCRAAQMIYDPMAAAIISERMAYEPYLGSHLKHEHKQYMQQPMMAPSVTMYGGSSVVPKTPLVLQCNPRIMPLGDMSIPTRREDAGEKLELMSDEDI